MRVSKVTQGFGMPETKGWLPVTWRINAYYLQVGKYEIKVDSGAVKDSKGVKYIDECRTAVGADGVLRILAADAVETPQELDGQPVPADSLLTEQASTAGDEQDEQNNEVENASQPATVAEVERRLVHIEFVFGGVDAGQFTWDTMPEGVFLLQDNTHVLLSMPLGRRIRMCRKWNEKVGDQSIEQREHFYLQATADGVNFLNTAVTFDDVIGQDEAKRALMNIVRYLKNAKRVAEVGARMPKGVLLIGDPGNGKTLLAEATAGEAGVPFFQETASNMVDKFIGNSAKNIKSLFTKARKANSPAIIFIDEIDSIAQKRSSEAGGSADQEFAATLNTLLAEMNGFDKSDHPIIVIGATNRPEVIDTALLRAGRFDRKIEVANPKHGDFVKLFEHYSQPLTLDDDADFEACAKKCAGLPAASVPNICNNAALALFDADESGELGLKVSQQMLLDAVAQEVREQVARSKGKRFNVSDDSIKLADVIGQDGAKEDVQDIISYLKNPSAYKRHGAKTPRGMLFVGTPGEGKTRLARAVAGEAEVPFFSITGSDFVEKFVGVGAQRVRDLFAEARRNAPCIVFIDEIDAIGRRRGASDDGGSQERENTLNALLTEMDGFSLSEEPVVVFAATNRKDILDPALTRAGRLDREATFYRPDVGDRVKLFQYYTRDKKLAEGTDLEFFARNTFGFSAASIEGVCNEAVLLMIREGAEELNAHHLDQAITRITVGPARKGRKFSAAEVRNTAVHEAGHAVVWHVASGGEPIARITVVPAGDSGGHVQTMNDDHFYMTDKTLFARVAMAMAGRAAQEIVLQTTDTGASSDFQQARSIATSMVVDYGMSELGPVPPVQGVERSPEMLAKIEEVVNGIIKKADELARSIINDNREGFDRVVDAVIEKETLLGPEFEALWNGVESTDEQP